MMRDRRSTEIRRLLPVLLLFVGASGAAVYAADPSAALEATAALEAAALTLAAMGAPIASALRRGRGRPRKFAAPSRAVTLTLPESVLAALTSINPDPSQAIVQLVKRRTPANGRQPAELAVFGRRAVITIRPTASLEQRTGVDLVPLPDGRALISFDQPKTIADLELLLMDAIEDPKLPAEDRKVFEGIAGILKEARQSSGVSLLHRSIIVLESAHGSPRSAATPASSASAPALKRRSG